MPRLWQSYRICPWLPSRWKIDDLQEAESQRRFRERSQYQQAGSQRSTFE